MRADEPKPAKAPTPVLTTGEPFFEPPWPRTPIVPPIADDMEWELLLEGCDVDDAD